MVNKVDMNLEWTKTRMLIKKLIGSWMRNRQKAQRSRNSATDDNWKADGETHPEKTQMSTYANFTSKSCVFPSSLHSSMTPHNH